MNLNYFYDFSHQNFISVWDYWVFGFCPSTAILKNTVFWKLGLIPSSGEIVERTYFTEAIRKKKHPVSEKSCSLEYRTMNKILEPNNP
jgi:hypothetical protein